MYRRLVLGLRLMVAVAVLMAGIVLPFAVFLRRGQMHEVRLVGVGLALSLVICVVVSVAVWRSRDRDTG